MRRALLALIPTVALAGPTWQPDWSPKPLTAKDAEAYCAKRGKAWRLPTKLELANVPGKLPATGYLWSGEDVSEDRVGQRWIMNLANKHVFNGEGRKGYAKCLHGPIGKLAIQPLGAPYLVIGDANAKHVVGVAAQPDYPWWKIRPVLDELVAAHDVRFDVRMYTVDPRHDADAITLCAASARGKRADVEAALAAKKPVPAALAAELEPARAGCRRQIEDEKDAIRRRGVTAVPTFWLGSTTIVGAKPVELRDAVEAFAK